MCDINGPFKLCTCDDKVDKNKPHWILKKSIVNSHEEVVGSVKEPKHEDFFTLENIFEQLNNGNPFDFDYKPKNNDLLKISLGKGKQTYYYRYFKGWLKKGYWEFDFRLGDNSKRVKTHHGYFEKI